ncbi:MAG TPA: hypothetical protein VGO00_21655 [Kofleriaceae bacterium]|nr:hypothetical protein [Kofleriaceae bacterium]
MRALGMAVWLGACSFTTPKPAQITGDGPPPSDTNIPDVDAPPATPLCPANELGLADTCMTALPTSDVTFNSVDDLDTDSDGRCDQTITSVCWIAGVNVIVTNGALVEVHGARALVVDGMTSITIDGGIDTSSTVLFSTIGGPASNGSECKPTTPATVDGGGGGGGAGGSFGDKGGDGGDVADTGQPHAGAGKASSAVVPTLLQGGCSGGPGANTGAAPGRGGGAVYFVSPAISIESMGVVNGSGAGGSGATSSNRGGGGGGSGGLIAFDTPNLTINMAAQLFANGGGGGQGSGGLDGGDGIDPVDPGHGGVGGTGATGGGAGGDGGLRGTAAKVGLKGGPSGPTGGGGGGGSAGVIVMFHGTAPVTGAVSPAFTQR